MRTNNRRPAPAAASTPPAAAAAAAPETEIASAETSAPNNESAPSAPPADEAGEVVEARVLIACAAGEPNDVVLVNADELAAVGELVDTDPAAVAYAKSLQA
jgi:hypothetical protein